MIVRILRTTVLVGLVIALGCEVSDSLSSEPSFGDPYTIATATSPNVATPRLDADGLHVTVQYSGGCKAHTFDVRFRVRGASTEIWIEHDDRGDLCEAYNTLPLSLAVSRRALETATVVLLTPDDTEIPLR